MALTRALNPTSTGATIVHAAARRSTEPVRPLEEGMHVDLISDDKARPRPVHVALVGCTGILGEVICRIVRAEPDFVVVETFEPSAVVATNRVGADIVLWNDAEEAVILRWLDQAHSVPPVLATLADGRGASLWQLTPQRTDLGALSPSTLVQAIRTRTPIQPGEGTDPEEQQW